MINGVLVERTVKEVKPALKTNSDGLKKVLDDLLIQYKTKQDEMDKWKVCSALRDLYYLSMLLLLSTALTKYMSLLLWFIKKYQTARSMLTVTTEEEQYPSGPAIVSNTWN
jgi:hypothetical protein